MRNLTRFAPPEDSLTVQAIQGTIMANELLEAALPYAGCLCRYPCGLDIPEITTAK